MKLIHKKTKKIVAAITGVIMFFGSSLGSYAAEQNVGVKLPTNLPVVGTPVKELANKGVRIAVNKKVETDQPARIQMATGTTFPTGAQYRINKLPYKEDKNKNAYMVIPKLGVVVPVVDIEKDSADYKLLLKGKDIDYNTYLHEGILRYPSVTEVGATGNMVFFGHSSYRKNDAGKYKTIFTTIPLMEVRDQIRIYVKQKDGSYKRFVFKTESSYETSATDVSVMKSTNRVQITLSTCVPIGTAQKRRIVSAILDSSSK